MEADGPAAGADRRQVLPRAGVPPQPQASLDSSAQGSAAAGGLGSDGDGLGAAGGTDMGHSSSNELPPPVAEAAQAGAMVPPEQGGPAGHPGMYGRAPPHERFDVLLARFQSQVGVPAQRGSPTVCSLGHSCTAHACSRWQVPPVVHTVCSSAWADSLVAAPPCACRAQVSKVKTFLEEQQLRLQNPASEPGRGSHGALRFPALHCMRWPPWLAAQPSRSPLLRSCLPARLPGRCHCCAAAVLSTATRGQLLPLVIESLGICRDLLRVGERLAVPQHVTMQRHLRNALGCAWPSAKPFHALPPPLLERRGCGCHCHAAAAG